jgi:hypothetical protein
VISLRYHIVSLVAVFLALTLGIVVGGTVLKEPTIALLRTTSRELRQTSQQYRTENQQLKDRVRDFQQFGAATLPSLVRDKLKNHTVVLVDTDRVDNATRDRVTEALRDAGATYDGRITFATGRLALTGQGDRDALRRLLATDATDPAALRTGLVGELVDRLAVPSRLPTDDRSRPADVLTGLQDARFLADLKLEQPGFAKGQLPFPRPGSLFVLLGPTGPTDQTDLQPQAFLLPMADRLALRSRAVVAAERADGPTSWVAALRDQPAVASRVSTVDDVDLPYGQFTLVEALQRRLLGQTTGQYGTKPGASLLPAGLPGS